MEELLVYAILFYEEIIVTEALYREKLDFLFLKNPDHELLLTLEWETDITKAIRRLRTSFDDQTLNQARFGAVLMEKLREYYDSCPDLKRFANHMYRLWEILPGQIQDKEPFWTLCYADDPLSWGDEKQTRLLYEKMLHYYEN